MSSFEFKAWPVFLKMYDEKVQEAIQAAKFRESNFE